jgi:hypothetical protein
MRMWMLPPETMCWQHLVGEHGELHKHLHNWRSRHRIDGRIAGNAIEPMAYKERHDELADEMIRRGYKHDSPLDQPDFSYLPQSQREAKVNSDESRAMLIERCAECREMSHNKGAE